MAMKKRREIFRGAGAQATLEAAAIRAMLQTEGVPSWGEDTPTGVSVEVLASHYKRAAAVIRDLQVGADESEMAPKQRAAGQ
jgi:hypothetical protein